ncbi:AAA family ATPase [Dactylosporangium sp. NPDC006015]|uniref:ATP-binding protein n=1 Tax=Dactylosporangium sp. NPDC006015 TaxID=3154576 RepID=UPI0033A29950
MHLQGLPGFLDGHIRLNAGLTLFCGVNASGKTRLLRSVAASLGADVVDEPILLPSFGKVNEPAVPNVVLGIEGNVSQVYYIDIFHLSQVQLRSTQIDRDLGSRVEQAGESNLRPKELRLLSWLVGRDYQQASIAELDATVDESSAMEHLTEESTPVEPVNLDQFTEPLNAQRADPAILLDFRPDVLPYFTLTYNGKRYGTESISRGELAAMNLLWVLKSAEPESILFFDEPDLFLSTESSARALTVIADYANSNKSPIVVATHSAYGLAKAPSAYRVLLRNVGSGDTRVDVGSDSQMWRALRTAAPTNLVLAVEDEAGRQWAQLFAAELELNEKWAYEIWNFTDSAKVRSAAAMPDVADATLRYVGVLDGDERAKSSRNLQNIIFLPTSRTPEEFLLDLLKSESQLDEVLSRSREKIIASLSLFEGDDPHDRVNSVASDLGFNVAQLRGMIWQWYFSTAAGQEALAEWRDFFAELKAPVRRGRG